nr:myopalladin-like [Dermacentor andersoni]
MGDEVIALCVVKKGSAGPYHVEWRKDGAELRPTGRLSLSALSQSSTALRIESLRPDDIGNYTCTARNAFGSDTVTASLVVNGNTSSIGSVKLVDDDKKNVRGVIPHFCLLSGPPKVFEFTFPPEVALGDEILAGCVVKKGTLGPYFISWHKDGTELVSGDRVSVSGQSKTSAALRIAAVRPEDVGNYTCVARNSFGSDSFTAPLVVYGNGYSLSILTVRVSGSSKCTFHSATPRMQDVSERRTARAECVIQYIRSREAMRNCVSPVTLTLLVFSMMTSSTLSNAPPKVAELAFPSDVALGDEVIVSCVVKKGSAGPFVVGWFKDGEQLKNAAGRVAVSTPSKSSATLHIAALRAEDVGNYTCVARNRFGSDSATGQLVVQGNSVTEMCEHSLSEFLFLPERDRNAREAQKARLSPKRGSCVFLKYMGIRAVVVVGGLSTFRRPRTKKGNYCISQYNCLSSGANNCGQRIEGGGEM